MAARPESVVESHAVARLSGGTLPYVLRRSPRARRLRVTIDPVRGVVVSLPPAGRRGWARAEPIVLDFLADREAWIRGHLERQQRTRAGIAARPPLDSGRLIPFLGVPHRVVVLAAPAGLRATRVTRVGADHGDELVVERVARDARPAASILEAWFRARARAAIETAVERHAGPLGVRPARITIRDTTSRWGSCSRSGTLSFSWRLVLAPPEALDAVAAHEVCHLRVFGHGPRFRSLLDACVPDHAAWRRWLRRHSPELHAALE